jgi:bis(5'-nucleosyl)-tetraphosphatase (symmetrical)
VASLIVYGDIHGCYKSLKSLRKEINPKKSDIEVCVGDVITKGKDSIRVLDYLIKKNIKSVLGNHEDKLLRYLQHAESKKKNPVILNEDEQEIVDNLSKNHIDYLKNMPYFIKQKEITILHGGVLNHFDLDNLSKKEMQQVIRLRYIDDKCHFISYGKENEKSIFWTDIYNGNQGFIVYGHRWSKEVKISSHAVGIDTGCVYGNRLSAVVFKKSKVANLKNYSIKSID